MKLHYKNLKLKQVILFATVNLFLISCGTYQSVYNEDGIYGDVAPKQEEKKVIVLNGQEYDDYEDNYFTKSLENLQRIEATQIFTDVNSYNSDDPYMDDEIIDETLNYNANQPWGYEDNDVVVHINLMNDPFMFGNNWGIGLDNGWGYNAWLNGWGFNN
ncbi:MAG: hypothetical protein ACJA1B_003102, partial [Polaribacter sp.]